MLFAERLAYFEWKYPKLFQHCSICLALILYPFMLIYQCLICPLVCVFGNSVCYKPSYTTDKEIQQHGWKRKCKRCQRKFERTGFLGTGSALRRYNQQDSSNLLSRLPIELRRQIYGYVLSHEPFIHLTIAAWRRVVALECEEVNYYRTVENPREDESLAILEHAACMQTNKQSWKHRRDGSPELPTKSLHVLPLLKSCRKV
jgi:hypothetical protein